MPRARLPPLRVRHPHKRRQLLPGPVKIPPVNGAAALRRAARHLVGQHEIASRVGMSKNAVGTWRRRQKDFPLPLVTLANGRIYDWREVRAWLVARGIGWTLRD